MARSAALAEGEAIRPTMVRQQRTRKTFCIKFGHAWSEFETLVEKKPEAAKKITLLVGIKEALPQPGICASQFSVQREVRVVEMGGHLLLDVHHY